MTFWPLHPNNRGRGYPTPYKSSPGNGVWGAQNGPLPFIYFMIMNRYILVCYFLKIDGVHQAPAWSLILQCLLCVHGCCNTYTGGAPGRDRTPKGAGATPPPPPLRTPKLSHSTICFVGAGGAGDFVLGIRHGKFFFVRPYVSVLKTLRISWRLPQWLKSTKKVNLATLPTCGPLLILPPALKRRGSPRWQGLYSHLAHKWATCDFAARSKAVGIPRAARVM